MPQSSVFSFTDPDAYQERVRGSDAVILSLGRGEFRAHLARVDLGRLWMQWGSDNLPRVSRTTMDERRAIVNFLAEPEHPPAQQGGHEMTGGTLAVFGKGSTNVVRSQGGYTWASLSLAHADLAAAGEAIAGRELTCPRDTHFLLPPPRVLTRLRRLHARAAELARTRPAVLANPASAKALEQQLTHAMIEALTAATPQQRRWLPGQHGRIVNRFLEFLEGRPDEPAYIAEICAAIGASERTLRTCCQEVLGVGPVRYLWLRRMHLARQALLHADPLERTVTDIATAHGFWELGRFSVEYRTLFGESPSTSLRRKLAA